MPCSGEPRRCQQRNQQRQPIPVRSGSVRPVGVADPVADPVEQKGHAGQGPAAGGFFPWREEWTLGIAALDLDHRQLAALLDRIGSRLTAAPPGVAKPAGDAVIADLALLGALTRVHFRCEENLMRHSDYPDFNRHKAEHDLLLAEYTDLVRELASGAAGVLDLGVLSALKAWFLGHLLDDDRRLAAHLHQVGIGTAQRRNWAPVALSSARHLPSPPPSKPLP